MSLQVLLILFRLAGDVRESFTAEKSLMHVGAHSGVFHFERRTPPRAQQSGALLNSDSESHADRGENSTFAIG